MLVLRQVNYSRGYSDAEKEPALRTGSYENQRVETRQRGDAR